MKLLIEGGGVMERLTFEGNFKDYPPDMDKVYPIFWPLSCGGTCKDFRRRKGLSHD